MPLFDWGGLRLEEPAVKLLHQHVTSLERLSVVFGLLLAQPCTEVGHTDLQSKQGVCDLLLQRLRTLLWFCSVKLLPEVSRELSHQILPILNNFPTLFHALFSAEDSNGLQAFHFPKDSLHDAYDARRDEITKLHKYNTGYKHLLACCHVSSDVI